MIEKTVAAGTERLYYEDSHLREFTARVMRCRPDKAGYLLELDRTAFFPEGGGQAGDVGQIDDAAVTDTREKDGIILHLVDREFLPGETVTGRLDWAVRFDRMQQHSAEHIVSGLVHRYFGYDNVGFHLGNEGTTLDFNGEISPEELRRIEYEANEAVSRNVPFVITFPTKEEEAALDYRSKLDIQGQVRLVTVPGYDMCACCAPHVTLSGEIGMIKIADAIRYKGGVRVTILCGMRALADYRAKEAEVKTLSVLLSTPAGGVADAVRKLKAESEERRGRLLELQDRLLRSRPMEGEDGVLLVFEPELDKNAARKYVNDCMAAGFTAAVFTGSDEAGWQYVMGSREKDLRSFAKALQEAFSGRGGGRPEMIQGQLTGTEAGIRHFIGENLSKSVFSNK